MNCFPFLLSHVYSYSNRIETQADNLVRSVFKGWFIYVGWNYSKKEVWGLLKALTKWCHWKFFFWSRYIDREPVYLFFFDYPPFFTLKLSMFLLLLDRSWSLPMSHHRPHLSLPHLLDLNTLLLLLGSSSTVSFWCWHLI